MAKKAINKTPCPMPTYFTKMGVSQMYLRGIAIKSNNKKEIPSNNPTRRNVLIVMIDMNSKNRPF
jgi:hypothetical protein